MNKKLIIILSLAFSFIFSLSVFASGTVLSVDTESGKVNEYYVDTNGRTIKSKTYTDVSDKSSYAKNAPDIDDYVCVNARVNENNLEYNTSYDYDEGIQASISNFSSNGDYVVFIYKNKSDSYKKVQDVEVNYYNYTTGELLDTTVYEDQRVGSNFDFTISNKKTFGSKNYHFVKSSPKASSGNDLNLFVAENSGYNDIDLYYNYGSADSSFITIHYIDVDTNKEMDTDYIYDLEVGENYTYTIKSKGGYNFVSSSPSASSGKSITIKVDEDNEDNEIYCYYRKIYKETNSEGNTQYYVSPSDTFFTNGSNNPNSNIVIPVETKPITSDGLSMNTNTFYSFVAGYPNNSFRPNNYITRAEASQMFYNILNDKTLGNGKTSYTDLYRSSWYYDSMNFFASRDIIKGYSDNTIRPNNNITRAEFTKMATEINGFGTTTSTNLFTDVTKYDWYYYYVRAGVDEGLISGYDQYTFKPNSYITRSEAIKIIDLMIGRTIDRESLYADVYYNDVYNSMWQYNYIKMTSGKSAY